MVCEVVRKALWSGSDAMPYGDNSDDVSVFDCVVGRGAGQAAEEGLGGADEEGLGCGRMGRGGV